MIDPATFLDGKFKDGAAINKQFNVLCIGLGTKEPNPFPGSVGAFRNMLDKQGIKYVFYESPGTAHEWLTWRRDLNNLHHCFLKNNDHIFDHKIFKCRIYIMKQKTIRKLCLLLLAATGFTSYPGSVANTCDDLGPRKSQAPMLVPSYMD